MKLPGRNDDIYTVIEGFKDYEYTNCIAYEMAIRNDEVKSLLREIVNYPLYEYSPFEDKHFELDKELESIYFIDYKIRRHIEKGYDFFIEVHHKEFSDMLNYVKFRQILKREEFKEDILNNLIEDEKKVLNYYYKNFEKLEFVWDKHTTEEDRIHTNSKPLVRKICGINADGKLITEEDEKKAIIEDRNFLQFKRPRLSIPKDLDKTINISINPNLPLEELKAYIEHIKLEYDKENSIIKSPLELLGEEISAETIDFKNMTSKEWADCFFIYDYYKLSTDNQKTTKLQNLQDLLTEYNGFKVEKTKEEIRKSKNRNDNSKFKIISFEAYTRLKDEVYNNKEVKPFYSIATIKDRLKLMTSLIDELKYKTLIS